MKKVVNICASVVLVATAVVGFYFSDFSGASLMLGSVIMLLWIIIEYLLKCNEDLQGDKDKVEEEKTRLNDKIQILNERISRISIVANQGSPYKIQVVSRDNLSAGIKLNKDYTVEVILSTLDKKYDIKYLNVSFNQLVHANQQGVLTQNNMYKEVSNVLRKRNSRYEYSLELKDEYKERNCAKCVFKFKYEHNDELDMSIEVNSGSDINKIETITCPILKDR